MDARSTRAELDGCGCTRGQPRAWWAWLAVLGLLAGCGKGSAPSAPASAPATAAPAPAAPAPDKPPAPEQAVEESDEAAGAMPVEAPAAEAPAPAPAPTGSSHAGRGNDDRSTPRSRPQRPPMRNGSEAGSKPPVVERVPPARPMAGRLEDRREKTEGTIAAPGAVADVDVGLIPVAQPAPPPAPPAPPPAPAPPAPDEPQPAPQPQRPPAASVEDFYAGLPEEAIAFHVPGSVQRGQVFVVRLVVQPGQSEAALEGALVAIVADAGPAPAPGDIRTRTTKIGDEMQASLTSPTLQIVARGDDKQLVRRDAVTEWAWDVTAAVGGTHHLTLSLYAIPQGRSSGIKVKTFEETLTVEVALLDEVKDTIADNWEWMWTFILGPLGAVAWRRRQRRHVQAG